MIKRYEKNPILTPDFYSSWEALAVFNPSCIKFKNKIYMLYRALSLPHYHHLAKKVLSISDIGICESDDGINFKNRRKFIFPEYDWEKFGCEDARVVEFENKFFIFYTALSQYPFNANGIKVGLAISKDLKKIDEKHLITPFNAKAMALFPERINGKIYAILTVNTDNPPVKIAIWEGEKIEDLWDEKKWLDWYNNINNFEIKLKRKEDDYIEVGTQPIKTEFGWLIFISYIKNYFSPSRIFTVEAIILDLNDPKKVIGRTKYPLLYPLYYYEKFGIVNNVVFPTGAILNKNTIYLYYGAADTYCALCFVDLEKLNELIFQKNNIKFEKISKIISPTKNKWEKKATFNPGAIYLENEVHIIYRAMDEENTSVFGYAKSKDGINIDLRLDYPIYIPREDFEKKLIEGANSGCEDPRITYIKEDKKIYLLYTAYDGKNPPKVALSSINVKDFLNQKWNWEKPKIISEPNLDNKDACLFPEKIKNKYVIVHRIGNDIDICFVKDLNFENEYLGETRWVYPRSGYWDSVKVGIAAPPIKTKYGWLFFYHGVDENGIYRVGAFLADLLNPLKLIARSYEPLMEPELDWETKGIVNNVVFPCGAVMIKDKIFIYYGGADKYCGVATLDFKKILKHLNIK